MSKPALIALIFAFVFLGVLIYSTLGLSQYSCAVCVTYEGRQNCSTSSAPTEKDAIRTATDVACAPISSGMTESIQCSNTPPDSIDCSRK
ncbi:MAG: hypothetical protein O2968_13685 [Acidobacteria bacterium]|nr:hypothetical protein [Acidobacteriota bacterium]